MKDGFDDRASSFHLTCKDGSKDLSKQKSKLSVVKVKKNSKSLISNKNVLRFKEIYLWELN